MNGNSESLHVRSSTSTKSLASHLLLLVVFVIIGARAKGRKGPMKFGVKGSDPDGGSVRSCSVSQSPPPKNVQYRPGFKNQLMFKDVTAKSFVC